MDLEAIKARADAGDVPALIAEIERLRDGITYAEECLRGALYWALPGSDCADDINQALTALGRNHG
jgi:hypothetical protein